MTGTDSPVSNDSSTIQGPLSNKRSQGTSLSSWDRPVKENKEYDCDTSTHSHTTKLGPDQIERICRQQIKCNKNDSFCF